MGFNSHFHLHKQVFETDRYLLKLGWSYIEVQTFVANYQTGYLHLFDKYCDIEY